MKTVSRLTITILALVGLQLGLAVPRASAAFSWTRPYLISHQPPWSTIYGAWGAESVSMSCPTTTLCVAVDDQGNVITSTDPTGGTSKWKAVTIDNSWLESVSCASASLCVATDPHGNVLTSTNPTGGAQAWTITHVDTNYGGNLVSVTCVPGGSLCMAADDVGSTFSSIDPTGGASSWHQSATAVPGTLDYVTSVSCPSASLCVAEAGDGSGRGDIDVTTNPTASQPTWTIATGVSTHGFTGNISCPSASLCVAASARADGRGGDLLVSTNPVDSPATWTHVDPVGNDSGSFRAVSCPSTALCVGMQVDASVWTSTNPTGGSGAWSGTAGNITGAAAGGSPSVACGSPAMCIALQGGAVASATDPTGGTNAWTPEVIDVTDSVSDISCVSTTFCAAVDNFGNVVTSSDPGTAGTWSATNLTDFTHTQGRLSNIACKPDLCVAANAGESSAGPGNYLNVWTSTDAAVAWSSKESIGLAGSDGTGGINAMSCASSSFCAIQVGDELYTSTTPTDALSWTANRLWIDTNTLLTLTSLSCTGAKLCVGATGNGIAYSTDPAGGVAAWKSVDLGTGLRSVSCASATLCVAVDYSSVYVSTNPTGGAAAWIAIPATDIEPHTYSFTNVTCSTGSLCLVFNANGVMATSVNPAGGAAAWSATTIPTGDRGAPLAASCAGATLCIASDGRGDAYAGTPAADTRPPSISITTPVDGHHYAQNAVIDASYSCSDEQGGSGVDSCVGPVANGAAIETSSTGQHTFTVHSADVAGNASTMSVTYYVDPPAADVTAPSITIAAPLAGSHFAQDAVVQAFYTCSDQGGSGLASCDGTVPNGSPLDTASVGQHSFTVTASDHASNPASVSLTYFVDAPSAPDSGSNSTEPPKSTAPTAAPSTTTTTTTTTTTVPPAAVHDAPPVALDPAVIRAIQALATPAPRQTSARTIEKAGGWPEVFSGPRGSLTILISSGRATGARVARTAKAVVIARLDQVFASPGKHEFVVKLTQSGRKILRRGKGMTLTTRVAFTPAGGPPVTVAKTFRLKR